MDSRALSDGLRVVCTAPKSRMQTCALNPLSARGTTGMS